jgi:hypothetical protein
LCKAAADVRGFRNIPSSPSTHKRHACWLVGNEYLVPGLNNEEVMATLQNATVSTETKTMHGVFQANDVNFVVQASMTDAELAAYLRSPETFFGIVQHVGRHANNAFELAEFFYENYKNTSKERLLEFLKDHPTIEGLRHLSQQDLAVFVSEQWALSAEERAERSNAITWPANDKTPSRNLKSASAPFLPPSPLR